MAYMALDVFDHISGRPEAFLLDRSEDDESSITPEWLSRKVQQHSGQISATDQGKKPPYVVLESIKK